MTYRMTCRDTNHNPDLDETRSKKPKPTPYNRSSLPLKNYLLRCRGGGAFYPELHANDVIVRNFSSLGSEQTQ